MEILLADDDPEVLAYLVDLLRTEGHRVTAVSDGAEALNRLRERRFDLLVSDLEMPGVEGDAVIRRARELHPGLPAMLVSSHPEAPARGERLGVPVLAKPTNLDGLRTAIDRALRSDARPTPASDVEPVPPGSVVVLEPARRGVIPWFPGLAAAVLMLAAGLLFLRDPSAPDLPEPPASSVVRGGGIELVSPTGPLAATPTTFAWRTTEPHEHYRVVLEGVDGRVLYQQLVAGSEEVPGSGLGGRLDLPADVVSSLHPMVSYTWWVESQDADGMPTGQSSRGRFRVLVDALPSTGESP